LDQENIPLTGTGNRTTFQLMYWGPPLPLYSSNI
jgi:hypothetical protein